MRVTIENLAPADGTFLTPVWVAFHDGTFDLYDLGAPASAPLERLAEDGNTGPLATAFGFSGAGTAQATILGPGGPIAPGETARMTFRLDARAAGSRFFSYAAMVIPSNDAFVASADPTAHAVFDELGNFVGGSFVIRGSRVLDAGTEVNDEVPANTAFFGQMAPDTGVVEGGVVAVHPGFQAPGSGGILDDPRFSGGDFTRPGYAVARITLTAVAGTTIRFPLGQDQVVPPTGSAATGVCRGVLDAGDRFHLECEHDVAGAVAAHIHRAPAGENGPVIFDLGDPSSPIVATWEPTPDEVEALLAGELYVQVHSPAFPPGEIRGQIDGCFDGPTALCLNGGRFRVTARWETAGGMTGDGRGVQLTGDSGHFWFFSPVNIEMVVKVLDACVAPFDSFWVFAGGLTDVGVELVVEDTQTGEVRTYDNELGTAFQPIRDTSAFATCP